MTNLMQETIYFAGILTVLPQGPSLRTEKIQKAETLTWITQVAGIAWQETVD